MTDIIKKEIITLPQVKEILEIVKPDEDGSDSKMDI